MPDLHNGTLNTTIADADRFAFGQPGQLGAKNIVWSALKTFLSTLYMSLTGDQTIAGVKTFSSSPKVPNPTASTDAVNLQTLQAVGAMNKKQYPNQTANFQHLLSANQSLERFDFRLISGSVTIRVGTTSGGDEIVTDRILDANDLNVPVPKSYPVDKILYVTIANGGTVSINVWYLNSIF